MKQYDTFASDGGYRYAGAIWAGGPVLDASPWFRTAAEARIAAEEQRELDQQWLRDEMARLGITEADLHE